MDDYRIIYLIFEKYFFIQFNINCFDKIIFKNAIINYWSDF